LRNRSWAVAFVIVLAAVTLNAATAMYEDWRQTRQKAHRFMR
jgi:hypothetical protein